MSTIPRVLPRDTQLSDSVISIKQQPNADKTVPTSTVSTIARCSLCNTQLHRESDDDSMETREICTVCEADLHAEDSERCDFHMNVACILSVALPVLAGGFTLLYLTVSK